MTKPGPVDPYLPRPNSFRIVIDQRAPFVPRRCAGGRREVLTTELMLTMLPPTENDDIAPSVASRFAIPTPMPFDAPVMTANLIREPCHAGSLLPSVIWSKRSNNMR